jgi:hypothetical protein
MGPLTFLNGAFLAALSAASLPILIHLFSRRKAREIPFSNLDFLDEITRKRIRRMRLRQWLLLALRTLAIALVALALSRPVWHGPGAARQRGSSTVAILFDDSFSMEAQLDPGRLVPIEADRAGIRLPTRFEEARQRALQVVDMLEEGDRALLIFTATPLRVPYESTVRDPGLLREELQRARPRATRADLIGALERAYPLLDAAKTLNREIYIVSDFQQNQIDEILRGFSGEVQRSRSEVPGGTALPDSSRLGAAASTRPLAPVPEDTRLYLLPVDAPGSPNAAVVWGFLERDPAGPGGRVTVRLRNLGDSPIEESVLQILENDTQRLLAEGYVSIEPGGVAQTQIAIPQLPSEGLLTVRSGPDILERDNTLYLSTAASSRFRILLVLGGELSDPRVREEATYPILALDPWGGHELLAASSPGGATPAEWGREASESLQLFEVETMTEGDLGLAADLDADAVLMLNVGRLSAAGAELLERYLAEGGSVLIALGDRVDPRTYNTQILPRLSQVRLENVVGDPAREDYFSLRPSVAGHDIFEGFPLAPGEMLSSARFRRILGLRPGADTRTLAEFTGGRPALVEEPGLLLFASALDMRWSDFPTSASYLPFLHRALHHLILRGKIGSHKPLVGEPLSHPLPAAEGQSIFHCRGPGGIEIPLRIAQTERGAVLRSGDIPEPGFYHIAADPAGGFARAFAVNVDVRESDLTTMSRASADLLFGSETTLLSAEDELSRQVLQARYGLELWRLCLILAFLLLVAESLLARGRSLY